MPPQNDRTLYFSPSPSRRRKLDKMRGVEQENAQAVASAAVSDLTTKILTPEGALDQLATHEAAADPHPTYTTDAEAAVIAADAVDTHELEVDPHLQYTTDAEAEVIADASVATHAGISDPHPTYMTAAETTAAITAALAALFTSKGDVIAGTGAGTYTRLTAPASSGYFLVSDPSTPTGMRWIARTAEMATAVLAGADSVLVGADRVILE